MVFCREARHALAALVALSVAFSCAPLGESQAPRTLTARNFHDVLFAGIDSVWDARMDPTTHALWYSTGGGLVAISPDHTQRTLLTRSDGFPAAVFYGIERVGDVLWLGTDAGLVKVDARTNAIEQTWSGKLHNFPNNITFFVKADGNVLWLGTATNGLIRFDPTANATRLFRDQPDTRFNNSPVRAVSVGSDAVYMAAQVAGFFKIDKTTLNQTAVLNATGEPFGQATSVLADGSVVWLGTEKGLWKWIPGEANVTRAWTKYTTGNGLASNFVFDIAKRGDQLWVSTKGGESVLYLTSGKWGYLDSRLGLLSNTVYRLNFTADGRFGLFATPRGLAVLDFSPSISQHRQVAPSDFENFLTLPTHGPNAAGLYGGSEHNGTLWWGSDAGVASVDPATGGWTNFGERDGLARQSQCDTQPFFVNDVEWEHSIGAMFLGSSDGVWVLPNPSASKWTLYCDSTPEASNVYFHVDPDGDYAWLPEFGSGLVKWDWKTNQSLRYDVTNRLFSNLYITDARSMGASVWVSTYQGLVQFDKGSKAYLPSLWTTHEGLPSDGLRGLARDGNDLWLLTIGDGIALFHTDTQKIADNGIWNTSQQGSHRLNDDHVRALVHDGQYVWVGTQAGLGRIDLGGTDPLWWNVTTSPLPDDRITGLVLDAGVLYVSTHAGVARLDTHALHFLPMQIAPPSAPPPPTVAPQHYPPSVAIEAPLEGDAVAGDALIQGTASRPGVGIDRVEVSLDGGAWTNATGSEQWSYAWNLTGVPLGDHTISARAISGNQTSDVDLIHVVAVAVPKTPLALRHTPPDQAYVARPLTLTAIVSGDEPLAANVVYRMGTSGSFARLAMTRSAGGSAFGAAIPARGLVKGTLQYYIEATSGRLKQTLPRDASAPFEIPVVDPPAAGVTLTAPPVVAAKAGESVTFKVTITDTGTSGDSYLLTADGLRSSWASVPADPFHLGAGESVARNITVAVPANAFSDNTTLTLLVSSTGGVARSLRVDVPLQIVGVSSTVAPSRPASAVHGFLGLPSPALSASLAAIALAALLGTRRRQPR